MKAGGRHGAKDQLPCSLMASLLPAADPSLAQQHLQLLQQRFWTRTSSPHEDYVLYFLCVTPSHQGATAHSLRRDQGF